MRCVVKLLAVLLCSQLLVGSQAKLQTTFSKRFTRCSPNNRIIPCVSPGDIKSKDADLYMNTALSKLNGVLIPLSRQLKPVAIRAYDYLPMAGTLNWLLVEVADPAGTPWLLEVELQDSLPDPYTPPADKVKLQNFRISKPAKA